MPKENLCAVINAQRGHARRLDASPVHAEPSGVGERTGGLSSANVSWTIGDPFHTVAKNRPTGVDRSRRRASQQRRASTPGLLLPVASRLPCPPKIPAPHMGLRARPTRHWSGLALFTRQARPMTAPALSSSGMGLPSGPRLQRRSAVFLLRDFCRPDTLPTALRP